MKPQHLKYFLILSALYTLTGCENDTVSSGLISTSDYSVGVGAGGTGTGSSKPSGGDSKPKPSYLDEDDVIYDVVYSEPVVQECNGIKRTLQFLNYDNEIQYQNDRQELFSISSKDPSRLKLQITIENTTSNPIYEYTNGCKAAIQLHGSKEKPNTEEINTCLNDETIQTLQPNEIRTQNFVFGLPNNQQLWTLSYTTQYASRFYEHPHRRSLCDEAQITLDIQPKIVPLQGAPLFGIF